jgi:Acetyl xylan esterase (AXE1)
MGISRWFPALLLLASAMGARADEPARTRVLPTGQMMSDSRTAKLRTLNDYAPFKPPATLEEWQKRRQELREQVLVANGLWPMPVVTPLQPMIHGKMDMGRYTIEKVSFASMPGHYVTGNLYRPKNVTGKVPGILSPHGHWADGRFYDAFMDRNGARVIFDQLANGAEFTVDAARYPLQARCAQLATLGCVVFHYDMLGHADSKAIPHREGFLDAEAQLRLQSTMGLQTYNSLRALDFISNLPDVDAQRIGVTGASGGGTQTFVLCAIDDRPAVAFPAVMVSTGMQGGCVCENCSLLRVGTGNVELAAMFAPKPLGMTGANDWTVELASKGLPELKTLYSLYEVPENVAGTVYAQFGHNYNGASGLVVYEWFNKHFKLGHSTPIKELPFIGLSSRELTVYDAKHPRPKDEMDVTALRASMTEASDKRWASYLPMDKKSLDRFLVEGRTALRAMTGDSLVPASDKSSAPGANLRSAVVSTAASTARQNPDGLTWEKWTIQKPSSKSKTPAVLVYKRNTRPKSILVWVDPKGKSSILDGDKPSELARKALDGGAAILAIDMLGTGEWPHEETLPIDKNFAGYSYGYNLPLLSKRIEDILNAVAIAHDIGPKVSLVGFGSAGPAVLLANSLSGNAVNRCAADASKFNFASVTRLDDPMMLPGALKYGGLDCLASLNAPCPLLIHNSEGSALGRWLQAAYKACGHPENLELKTEAQTSADVVAWLVR